MNNQPPPGGNQGFPNQAPLPHPGFRPKTPQQQQSNLNPYAMEFHPPQPAPNVHLGTYRPPPVPPFIPKIATPIAQGPRYSFHTQRQVTQKQRTQSSQRKSKYHQQGSRPQPVVPKTTRYRVAKRNLGDNVICVSKRLQFGRLDDHIYRKKLIRIRRDFDTDAEYTPQMKLSEPCDSFLCGGESLSKQSVLNMYYSDPRWTSYKGFNDFVDQNSHYPISWNSFIETFNSKERIAVIQGMGGSISKLDFQVFVSSLPYIDIIAPGNKIKQTWEEYFKDDHYKQLGTHVFVCYWGDLYMIVTYIDETQPNPKASYTTIGLGKLTAVYPVIRNDFELDKGFSVFCLGLYFDDPKAYYQGDRLYHRDGDYRLITHNVKDLQMLYQNHTELFSPTTDPFVAFYVGAGAKLVVLDNYGLGPIAQVPVNEQRHHNRTLIQQGGIVIFKGRLMVSMPILSQEAEDESRHDAIFFKLMTWQEFCTMLIKLDPENNHDPDPSTMTQPIICLGAQDSKYNSIAWSLSVEELPLSSRDRRIVLQVPFGARFISIDQGTQAMYELTKRVAYSMLHDSVVTQHYTRFTMPDSKGIKSLTNILNMNDQRSYVVKDCPHKLEDYDLPKEFHFSKQVGGRDQVINIAEYQEVPLAVPPMYPVVCDVYPQGDYYNSLPSLNFQEENVDRCYYQDGSNRIRLFKTYGEDIDYIYREMQNMPQRQWKRVSNEDPDNIFFKSGQQSDDLEENYYRLGVDGWMYETLPIQEWHMEDTWVIYHDHEAEYLSGMNYLFE